MTIKFQIGSVVKNGRLPDSLGLVCESRNSSGEYTIVYDGSKQSYESFLPEHPPTFLEKVADLPLEAVAFWKQKIATGWYPGVLKTLIEGCWGKGASYEEVASRLQRANATWTPEGWEVSGDVDLYGCGLTKLPVFKSVRGSFCCCNNFLMSLKPGPKKEGTKRVPIGYPCCGLFDDKKETKNDC